MAAAVNINSPQQPKECKRLEGYNVVIMAWIWMDMLYILYYKFTYLAADPAICVHPEIAAATTRAMNFS